MLERWRRQRKGGLGTPTVGALSSSYLRRSAATVKKVFSDPFKEAGPTPTERARSGRMNPEGVVVFYGFVGLGDLHDETRQHLATIQQ